MPLQLFSCWRHPGTVVPASPKFVGVSTAEWDSSLCLSFEALKTGFVFTIAALLLSRHVAHQAHL
ncbi:hypothetical protein L1049_025725 [Liquidambar formosana]|uniref:Uncharacterized protein n=1 Tax=Liquidambar formosana TaxID=63359 RepID=A0AAP0R6M0_LIQFO